MSLQLILCGNYFALYLLQYKTVLKDNTIRKILYPSNEQIKQPFRDVDTKL